MYLIVGSSLCIIIIFINNTHVYFQCCKICRCIMVSLIIFRKINFPIRKGNFILKLFLGNNQNGHLLLYIYSQDFQVVFPLSSQHQQYHTPLYIFILLYLDVCKLHFNPQIVHFLKFYIVLPAFMLLGFQNMLHR